MRMVISDHCRTAFARGAVGIDQCLRINLEMDEWRLGHIGSGQMQTDCRFARPHLAEQQAAGFLRGGTRCLLHHGSDYRA